LERGLIAPVLAAACGPAIRSELCGFGPVVAAARAAQLIAEHRPDSVLLVGIAGRMSDRLAIGEAYAFERVACHGVGAGSGEAFVPAEWSGWKDAVAYGFLFLILLLRPQGLLGRPLDTKV
jgi:hypothetical protein